MEILNCLFGLTQESLLLSQAPQTTPEIRSGSFFRNFLRLEGRNFSFVDAKLPKWYIVKKLRKISRETLCYVHEATSFFARRKNKSQSLSQFYVDLSEYPSSSSSILSNLSPLSNSLLLSCPYHSDPVRDLNDMLILVNNMIDNAIPLVIDGKPIFVDPSFSEESSLSSMISMHNL